MKKILLLVVSFILAQAVCAQKSKVVDYPYYETINTRSADIIKVAVDEKETRVNIALFLNFKPVINSKTTLVGRNTGRRYKLLSVDGAVTDKVLTADNADKICTLHFEPLDAADKICTLHFEPLDAADKIFDYTGGDAPDAWNIAGISTEKYSIKDIIKHDKKWGEKPLSPFADRPYCLDTVRIEGLVKNYSGAARLFYPLNFGYKNDDIIPDAAGRFVYKVPVMNTTIVGIDFSGSPTRGLLCEPGDTVRVEYDGTTRQMSLHVRDSAMQRSLDEYILWSNSRGYYRSGAQFYLDDADDIFAGTQCEIARRLIRLHGYLAEHPEFNERAAYFLRTHIKTDGLRELLQLRFSLDGKNGRCFTADQLAFIEELFTDIVEPLTLDIMSATIMRDYVGYNKNPFRGGLIVDYYSSLKGMTGCGEITLGRKELAAIDDANLAKNISHMIESGFFNDSATMAGALKKYSKAVKSSDALNRKYRTDSLPADKKQFYSLCTILSDNRHFLSRLPLSSGALNYAVATRLYESLLNDNSSWSDELLGCLMEGLEDFAPARLIVEQNNYLRSIENSTVDIKYLNSIASLSSATLAADSLLTAILRPHRGKVVYLDIWGSWCAPCKRQMAHVPALKEALKGEDVVFIYMAYNSPEEACMNIIKQYGIYGENTVHYNLPAQQQNAINTLLGVSGYPTYFLFDKEGNLVNKRPPRPSDKDALVEEIRKYINVRK